MNAHDEIHGYVGGSGGDGVNPLSLMISANEADVRSGEADDAAGGSWASRAEMSSSGLSSFSLYWDVASKAWKCHEPLVIGPDNSVISVEEPDGGYGNGTYYVHVKFDSETGTYSAEIKAGNSTGSDDEIAVIKLFTIADSEEGTIQYHTGVVSLARMTITGEEGETEGSDPTPVGGQVYMSGDASSGLIVKTFKKSNGEKHVCLDIEGRESGDAFGIHDVNGSDGSPTGTKVFATADIDLPEGGGGEDTVKVVTGVSLMWDETKQAPVLKVTYSNISGVTEEEDKPEDDETEVGTMVQLVETIGYNDNNNNCITQTRPDVWVLSVGTGEKHPEDVIETTEHSKE